MCLKPWNETEAWHFPNQPSVFLPQILISDYLGHTGKLCRKRKCNDAKDRQALGLWTGFFTLQCCCITVKEEYRCLPS